MNLALSEVSMIVSNEECVNFYKNLGFKEISREERIESHDELIYLSNGDLVLRLYKDSTHPIRNRKPESLGLRYLIFETDNLDRFPQSDIKSDKNGSFMFLVDPDGQPIQIREKR